MNLHKPQHKKHKNSIPRCVIIKLLKIVYKEKVLKADRDEISITIKGMKIRITEDVSQSWQNDNFEGGMTYTCQRRILYLVKV